MPEQLEDPRLENLQINNLRLTNPQDDNFKTDSDDLDFGLDQFFDSGLTANSNRVTLDDANVTGITITGFPGVGKTTLIESTFEELSGKLRTGVVEAEMTTEIDTDRLRLLGIPAVPILAEQSYRLTADMIAGALAQLDLGLFDMLFIEETAQLSALSETPYGSHKKVLVLSVTSGEDLPRKHQQLLAETDCVVITKTDLLPHLKADLGQLLDNIEAIRPGLPIFDLSAQTGDGMHGWINWLIEQVDVAIAEGIELLYGDKPVYVPFIG